ncbi:probable signal peptidase complex subunit 1 isoform X1 [Olea europaea var. sylvestris]|uniref:probable signal peptidase complex subunit 1 isoform X1 n=1 Tax=Olea europaea var. sylvestris TaxID=158386 RepID=UPI000C1CFEE9|nr:probable signal peptidase complex subunit 1 isoform X1 [Olea europaea var. sylvestris]
MSQEGRFCKIPLIRLLGAVTTELISSFTSTLESTVSTLYNLRVLVPLLHQTILSTVVTSPMDWQGQKLAEHLMQLMLVSFAVVAFIVGYVLGSFQTMLLIYAAGVVLTSLIIIPNWPFFNRHPLNWLDSSEAEKHPKPQAANSGPKKKASKK